MPKYEVLTPALVDHLEVLDPSSQGAWLFLEETEEFRGCWIVDSLRPEYFIDFEPLIGSFRIVTPVMLDEFLALAETKGYHVVFIESPEKILDSLAHLKEPPPFNLNSTLEHTVQGFLSWQIAGFNKLIRDESIRAGYVIWDTGAGKTAFITSAIQWHATEGHPFDLALVVVKGHNKIAMQRKLLSLAGIESIIIDGILEKRYAAYEAVENQLVHGKCVVAVTNYEKLRDDTAHFKTLFKRRDCLFFWDEMPAKLSNRNTQLYKATKKAMYDSFYSRPRPSWMRHWALTATPIENSPSDTYSCVNLMWPGLLGSVTDFYAAHVASYHPMTKQPQHWMNLDRLEAKLSFMMHRVSKEDPEVARMFPSVIPRETPIDWNPKHRAIYDRLTGKAQDMLEDFEDANILAMIQVMQMICDAPSMVRASAENREAFSAILSQFGDLDEADITFSGPRGSDVATRLLRGIDKRALTDVGHTKLETWRDIIVNKHPHDKIVTHSTWANYIFPVWSHWLDKWGVSYVIFDGTTKQKQRALDDFRSDPSIRVFLSGDSGADSIDIPEAAVGINYNIPWKWNTIKQREGRRDRVNSTFDTIYTYSLIMPDSVDERKLAVCERKHGYHVAIFDGMAMDESLAVSMTPGDLRYMLTGDVDTLD